MLDFDATPITAHSDEEGAAGHDKGGFGFNPLLVSCGREVLAVILRPGSAGANNAADHLDLFELALEELPREALDGPNLARSDSAGASHALADACCETAVRFSFGYAINERVREAILALPEAAWRPAIDRDNQPPDGAWVAELTDHLALDAWPEGSRLIVRRERPHPGAQTPTRDEDQPHAGARSTCLPLLHPRKAVAGPSLLVSMRGGRPRAVAERSPTVTRGARRAALSPVPTSSPPAGRQVSSASGH